MTFTAFMSYLAIPVALILMFEHRHPVIRRISDFIFMPVTFVSVLFALTSTFGVRGTWSRWKADRIRFDGYGRAFTLPDDKLPPQQAPKAE
ncbi:hypothetical protein [Nitrospirillum amazonense]|uniref:hypothetical protein n=1 Tax=Nitrospirillum amazonense TaxID=28077 RepID=UPI002412E2D7|nr:hypothetical protein [Nitrospirillum amazonense]MDG3444572.1 hypothetical protein [Nitrospirillum amazonense]